MVAGTHHNAHLVSQTRALGVVLVEIGCPHRRPEVVCLQAKQQLENLLVSLGVHTAEVFLAPSSERRPFVVNKNATVFHRRPVAFITIVVIQFVLMHHWCICHPVPRRYADAA